MAGHARKSRAVRLRCRCELPVQTADPMSASVQVFGCRPIATMRPAQGRRPKASEEGTRGGMCGGLELSWPRSPSQLRSDGTNIAKGNLGFHFTFYFNEFRIAKIPHQQPLRDKPFVAWRSPRLRRHFVIRSPRWFHLWRTSARSSDVMSSNIHIAMGLCCHGLSGVYAQTEISKIREPRDHRDFRRCAGPSARACSSLPSPQPSAKINGLGAAPPARAGSFP